MDAETGEAGNLWLNLSDGFIGGGRQNWDGSGGSGSALRHFEAMKAEGKHYPLVVKLGTITQHGADVYSYAPDEDDMVEDPKLAEHLAHWCEGEKVFGLCCTPLGCFVACLLSCMLSRCTRTT